MKSASFSFFLSVIHILFLHWLSYPGSAHTHGDFLECFSNHFSNSTSSFAKLIYTPNDTSYISVLNSTIQNPRFSFPSTPKPLVIVTPVHASQVQATVKCSKKHGLQIRTRSGGHDLEGLSYISHVPFVIIDLRNLSSISVNVDDKTAWVEAGATIGELYYRISGKSGNLGFPAGFCHTVGVGGHFSGGGYGALMRKYGLSADNIVDAHLVNDDGRILDRKSMGEDMFWAIRGGGAASFGVILSWKIKLVHVPSKVTVFRVDRNLEKNETKKIVDRWQYVADKFYEDLLIIVRFQTVNSAQEGTSKITLQASFYSLFLSGVDRLLPLMEKSFPELGLVREDCTEMSWIESIVYFAGISSEESREGLLDKTPRLLGHLPFKIKSDYVREPIPENALEKMWETLYDEEVGKAYIQFFPYGGRMSEISESEIPFPHRAGNLFHILYFVNWEGGNVRASKRHLSWIRRVYSYMTPYVSKNPRPAYFNYRDLDIGTNNNNGTNSYAQAIIWGTKYFQNNFNRLVHVKTAVDPSNLFRSEQSIPPLLRQ
ncbi:Xanthine dehydrogenase C subunit [Parasponia andersonii]|uniref:Xanthine dehydrogenase C subunit n=1 Tax=Parasponia andersonii TaxID=3476 RepID=A0A2P5BGJ0_PARAD|nr:Xanthine dehydrogenase C subunit [Parasponia andersonii]